jgi:heme/copper-type cytochrome/quinol oxidase subunit 3
LIVSNALALTFVVIKIFGDLTLIDQGVTPATNLMWACWFVITGVHAVHVLGGAIFTGWLAGPAYRMSEDDRSRFDERVAMTRRYWLFVDGVWLFIVAGPSLTSAFFYVL